jgi:hypothetical protein
MKLLLYQFAMFLLLIYSIIKIALTKSHDIYRLIERYAVLQHHQIYQQEDNEQ